MADEDDRSAIGIQCLDELVHAVNRANWLRMSPVGTLGAAA